MPLRCRGGASVPAPRGHFARLCVPSVIFAAAIAAAIVQA
jgi:hypothetical protein